MTVRHRAFDPATGDWVEEEPGRAAASPAQAAEGMPSAAPPNRVAQDPEALRTGPVATTWHVILAIDLALLAATFVGGAVLVLFPDLVRRMFPDWQAQPLTAPYLAAGQAVTFLLVGVIPFLWVVYTRVGKLHGAMHYLKMERPARSLLVGLVIGFATLAALALLVAALQRFGYTPSNPQADEIVAVMTWPLALFLAATAALGEEVLFRGLLQRWTGVWVQAALFGLAHLSYGTPLQVAIPFALGILWGYMVRRGARLWVTIGAHFAFDFLQFASVLVPHS